MRVDGACIVINGLSIEVESGAAVDQAALAIVNHIADRERLPTAAGNNALIAVIQADGSDSQVFLTDQRTGTTVLQCVTHMDVNIAVAARDSAAVAVVQVGAGHADTADT